MKRPEFQGDPRNVADIDAYVDALRAWENAGQLQKAEEPANPLAGIFSEALGDNGPQFVEGPTGPGGAPGADGAAGADGADGADGAGDASIGTYIRLSSNTVTTLGSGTGAPTATVLIFDNTNKNTDTDNYSIASNEITVADAGEYRIDYLLTWAIGSAGRRTMRVGIQKDSGAGFNVIGASFSFVDTDATFSQTNQGYVILTVAAGDKFRVQAQRNNGSMTTQTNISFQQFTLVKLAA